MLRKSDFFRLFAHVTEVKMQFTADTAARAAAAPFPLNLDTKAAMFISATPENM